MKQIGLPVIGVPAGDTSALEKKMDASVASLQTKVGTMESKVGTMESKVSTMESKVSTLESKVSTMESKVGTMESKVSTLEDKVTVMRSMLGVIQDKLLLPTILYNANDAEDAVVRVKANTDNTAKVSFEYAVVSDYNPGSQYSYRFSNATYTEATTTTKGVDISVPAGSSLLVRSLTATTWAEDSKNYNKFDVISGKFTLDGDITALVGWNQTDKSLFCSLFMASTGLVECTPGVLPATTLADSCYLYMFGGCTSLTTAPALPATTLADSCYASMFRGCTSLTYIKAMFIELSTAATSNWVKGVAANGTYVKNARATYTSTDYNAIPNGWTVETATE